MNGHSFIVNINIITDFNRVQLLYIDIDWYLINYLTMGFFLETLPSSEEFILACVINDDMIHKGEFFFQRWVDNTARFIPSRHSSAMTWGVLSKEVFSKKSCFKNFAHPLSEEENIQKYDFP